MQNLLEKHGYERCGTITIKDVFGRVKHRVGLRENVALTEGVFTLDMVFCSPVQIWANSCKSIFTALPIHATMR